jgi:hypothetical protein
MRLGWMVWLSVAMVFQACVAEEPVADLADGGDTEDAIWATPDVALGAPDALLQTSDATLGTPDAAPVPWPIDAATTTPTVTIDRSFPAPSTSVFGVTHDGSSLWVYAVPSAGGRFYRLNPQTGEVLSDFAATGQGYAGTGGMTWDGSQLVLANGTSITRLTTTGGFVDNHVLATDGSNNFPNSLCSTLASDGPSVLYLSGCPAVGTSYPIGRFVDFTVERLLTNPHPSRQAYEAGMTIQAGVLHVLDTVSDRIYLMDRMTGTVQRSVKLPAELSFASSEQTHIVLGLAHDGSGWWVVDRGSSMLYHLSE